MRAPKVSGPEGVGLDPARRPSGAGGSLLFWSRYGRELPVIWFVADDEPLRGRGCFGHFGQPPPVEF